MLYGSSPADDFMLYKTTICCGRHHRIIQKIYVVYKPIYVVPDQYILPVNSNLGLYWLISSLIAINIRL